MLAHMLLDRLVIFHILLVGILMNVITHAQFDIVLVCCVLGLKLKAKCIRVLVERFGLRVVRWCRPEDTRISIHQKHTIINTMHKSMYEWSHQLYM